MRGLLTAALAGAATTWTLRRTVRRWEGADDPTDGRPLELPDGDELTVESTDGAALAVRRMGDRSRPPIVLAHGWTADRRIWGPVARRLVAAGHQVVVYDQRGHGGSGVGSAGLTLPALGDDVGAVLAAVDAEGAVLAGHSMGGMAVQTFAVSEPDVLAARVGALVLVSTSARRPLAGAPGGPWERTALRATSAPLVAAAAANHRAGPWMVRGTLGRRPSLVALRATQATLVDAPAETRTGFLRAMAGLDLTGRIGSITTPTTVVYGTRDLLTPPKLNREIAERIPGATSMVLEGAGHQLPFEAPDQVTDALIDASRHSRTAAPLGRTS